ncbi:hypothetical protein ABB37_06927 [Leptomonas pyrrhocoris]|uniref:CULT domain-containing protein n=1 Tax=Leptomonas pyrrhocoris TaxID=157538 RepID=A0A0N0VEB7_LEPPY|nr:hypothetical protein ABB37_06927 [Leptomonas pyrrhocoris]KPA77551.1 hypothetical protein ABB37_06927 [Leptomonas pyrrhocoris]|eukprot:XP_015655990.1 hypothetical protein ABB37_06927 [Leptomonas pyrrhocoris]
MTTCAAPSASPTTPSAPTIEAFLCDNCRCPIGTVWDVLPAEAHAPVWKDQVYSYELDLFANGSPPIQAYSATNPSKRRFDLLRLAPYVTVHGTPEAADKEPEEGPPVDASASPAAAITTDNTAPTTTTTRAPPFAVCDTAFYSSEHSFFTGYAWCFCHCGNCGEFLGWGFASQDRLNAAAAAAAVARAREREAGNRPGDDGDASVKGCSRSRLVEEVGDPEDDGSRNAAPPDSAAAPPPSPSLPSTSPEVHSGDEVGEGASGDDSWEDTAVDEDDEENGGECEEDHDGDKSTSTVGVAPDFIGIIITNCTGEPRYPVASLLKEVGWRAWRLQRRRRVHAVTRDLRRLLLEDADGFHAHRIYYIFMSLVERIFQSPPATAHPVVGEDDVPSLVAIVAAARASVESQRESQMAQEHAEGDGGEASDDDNSGDDGEAAAEAPTGESESA